MMNVSRVLLLAVSVFLAPGIAAAQSVAQMLRDMNAAFTNHSYDGVFSYYTGGELASLRVVHKQVDGVQRERLVHLNGAPREIIRKGEVVSCIVMPGDDLIALEKSIPAGPFARAFVRQFDQISDTYTVGTFGEGRAAGRTAVRVRIATDIGSGSTKKPHCCCVRSWSIIAGRSLKFSCLTSSWWVTM